MTNDDRILQCCLSLTKDKTADEDQHPGESWKKTRLHSIKSIKSGEEPISISNNRPEHPLIWVVSKKNQRNQEPQRSLMGSWPTQIGKSLIFSFSNHHLLWVHDPPVWEPLVDTCGRRPLITHQITSRPHATTHQTDRNNTNGGHDPLVREPPFGGLALPPDYPPDHFATPRNDPPDGSKQYFWGSWPTS